jgi:hypothetical protein
MLMTSLVQRVSLLATAALLAACTTGANFPASRSQEFVLGKTTKQEVVTLFGTPAKEEVITNRKDIGGKDLATPAILTLLHYDYTEPPGEQALGSGFRPNRRAILYLLDNKLVGYFRASNFKADATRFDLEKVSALQKAKTTEADVLALIGPPGGRGIYPLALEQGGKAMFYDFVLPNTPPGSTTREQLQVFLSPDRVVSDFSVSARASANPIAPTPVIIPIYLPRAR